MNPHRLARLSVLLLLLAGCEKSDPERESVESSARSRTNTSSPTKPITEPEAGTADSDIIELDWDALIPKNRRLDKLINEYNEAFYNKDPRAKALMEKLENFGKEAPAVSDYDGKAVRLSGFVVPLEMNADSIREFLLVPYHGACIHVPPPPANQTVYVVTDTHNAYQGQLFDAVSVTGTISVEALSSELGDAGYRIHARKVEPAE